MLFMKKSDEQKNKPKQKVAATNKDGTKKTQLSGTEEKRQWNLEHLRTEKEKKNTTRH